jgi:hypothetical protein
MRKKRWKKILKSRTGIPTHELKAVWKINTRMNNKTDKINRNKNT